MTRFSNLQTKHLRCPNVPFGYSYQNSAIYHRRGNSYDKGTRTPMTRTSGGTERADARSCALTFGTQCYDQNNNDNCDSTMLRLLLTAAAGEGFGRATDTSARRYSFTNASS